MRRVSIVVSFSLALAGCVSVERKAEYAAWKSSEDGIANVTLETFEAKYQQGWRERAQAKRTERLEHAEYLQWLKSDDGVKDTSYEVFKSRYKSGWRERAEQKKQTRLANEAREREIARQKAVADELLRKRDGRIAEVASTGLKAIRGKYAEGGKFVCPYARYKGKEKLSDSEKPDWLSAWTKSRRYLSEADKLAGDALLSEFGTRYLPKAYATYEKKRDAAFELQQVFNEEFPKPWAIKEGDPKRDGFDKVLEKFALVRTEYFWCRDELIHYWYMLKLGVLDASDLAKLDGEKLSPNLLPKLAGGKYEYVHVVVASGDERAFAAKYAPESGALYQSLEQVRQETGALVSECLKAGRQMDSVRYNRAFVMQLDKLDDIGRAMNEITRNLKAWRTEHRTTLKSSEEVAKCDHELAKRIKPFVESLPNYVKTRVLGLIIPETDMIEIPNMKYRMQRTELTQLQWMLVMGYNPVRRDDEVGARKPVTNVSEEEFFHFMRHLREMDGRAYKIPTLEMWSYACGAGQQKLALKGKVNRIAWCENNTKYEDQYIHAVAMKEPNAWGLYDMLGNASECCIAVDNWQGMTWKENPGFKMAGMKYSEYIREDLNLDMEHKREWAGNEEFRGNGGFRLCLDEGSDLWKRSEVRIKASLSKLKSSRYAKSEQELIDRLSHMVGEE